MRGTQLVWLPPYSWCPANFGRHRGFNCPMPVGGGLAINLEVKPEQGHIQGGGIRFLAPNDHPAWAALLDRHHERLGLPANAGSRWSTAVRHSMIMELKPNYGVAKMMARAPGPRWPRLRILQAVRRYLEQKAEVQP